MGRKPLEGNAMNDYFVIAAKKFFVIFSGLVAASLLARYLGPVLRAEYAVVANYAAIGCVVLNYGVSNAYQASRRNGGEDIARAYIVYSVFFFLLIFSLALVGGFFFEDKKVVALAVTAVALLRMQLQSFSLVENIKGSALASVWGSVAELIFLGGLLAFFPAYLIFGLLSLILKDLVISVGSFIAMRGSFFLTVGGKAQWFRSWSSGAQDLFRNGFFSIYRSGRFFFLTVLIAVNYKINIIALDFYGVDKAVLGVFAVGVLVSEYLWIFSDIFKDVQTSRTARGGAVEGVARATRSAIFVTLVAYAAFLLVGPRLIPVFFGKEFEGSFEFALIMLVANLFMVPCKVIGTYYISIGRVSVYLYGMASSVVLNLIVCFFAIPVLGVYGALLGSIVSYFLAGLVVVLDFKKNTGVRVVEILVVRFAEIKALWSRLLRR